MATPTQTRSVENHRVGDIVIDWRAQRRVTPSHVQKLIDNFDIDQVGRVTLSRRSNGDLVILDGMHRVLALTELGLDDWEVSCDVYEGLTEAEEARKFLALNYHSVVRMWDKFAQKVRGEFPDAVEIVSIVESLGLKIDPQAGQGRVNCVAKLEKVYSFGPEILRAVLTTILAAWGTGSAGFDGHIVLGLGLLFKAHGDEIDRPALIKKLAKYDGRAAGLVGSGRGYTAVHKRTTLAKAIGQIALEEYNSGKQAHNKLPAL